MKGLGWVIAGFWLFFGIVHADDTDLFMGKPGHYQAVNVLFLLDNSLAAAKSADWPASAECPSASPLFCHEKAVLARLAQELKGQPISLGLMLFAGTGKESLNESGAYVRSALASMQTGSNQWAARIDALNPATDVGALPTYALALHEAYLYFQGMTARSGVYPLADPAAFAAMANYRKPLATCGRNYLVIISNGESNRLEDDEAQRLLVGLGGRLRDDPLALQPADWRTSWADEYARFLGLSGIITHTIDAQPLSSAMGTARTSWLRAIAKEGRGRYLAASNPDDLLRAMRSVLMDVSEQAGGFTAPTLPLAANRPGVLLDQIYVGLFSPSLMPRGVGNLKHYTLGPVAGNEVAWLDSLGHRLIDDATGIPRDDSVSNWTQVSDFWRFLCNDARARPGLCGDPLSASDSPDGAVVGKGSAAQMLRQMYAQRTLYTCPSSGGCVAGDVLGRIQETRFESSNPSIKPADFGTSDAGERDKIIAWVKGEDNTEVPERQAGEARPGLIGEVLHSAPVAFDYNRNAANCGDKVVSQRDSVVFYASNDGVLHAVKGGHGISDAGSELWGFIPSEAWPGFKRVRDNSQALNFPSIPLDDHNKPYLLDGPLSLWAEDVNHDCRYTPGVDSVLLFMGLRRGGRAIYAFDVSEPEHPKFLWRKDNRSSGFGELGQSWSKLETAKVRLGNVDVPVVIMGAGYDPASEDQGFDVGKGIYLPPIASQASMGRGIFVLSARTGDTIRIFGPSEGMVNAIPSDVAVLKQRGTGLAYRAYIGDTRGKLWRMDMDNPDPKLWKVRELASLAGTGMDARKFMYPPDVVRMDEGYAILVGSGDGQHPFEQMVRNRFFMIKDRGDSGSVQCESSTSRCDLDDATGSVPTTNQAKGWFIDLPPGESVVGSATTLGGISYFSVHQASGRATDMCVPDIGYSRLYALNYMDATGGWPGKVRGKEVPGNRGGGMPLPFLIEAPNAQPGTTGTQLLQGMTTTNVTQPTAAAEAIRKKHPVWWVREHED